MATLEKKDVNPVVILLANFCCLGGLGYILMGQTTKAIYTFILFVILVWVGIGAIVGILATIDGYQTAQALAAGEEVDENEYKLEIYYKLISILDKNAIYKG